MGFWATFASVKMMKMKTRLLLWTAMAALTLMTAACSKEDDFSDPEGTVTLNMFDEQNGKTLLGNSDVYINRSNNFVTSSCALMDLGKKGGLGAIAYPELKTLSKEMAVLPGHGYFVCKSGAVMTFDSGSCALPISTEVDYYKMYVNSAIEREGTVVGAVVRYVLARPDTYGLPEFGSNVGKVGWNSVEGVPLTLTLSTDNFEYLLLDDEDIFNVIRQGRKLIIAYDGDYTDKKGDYPYTLYLRIRGSYTRVDVTMSYYNYE